MQLVMVKNLESLAKEHKLDKSIVIWGMGAGAWVDVIIKWLYENHYDKNLKLIVDNFKAVYCKEYKGISVKEPKELRKLDPGTFCVLLSVGYSDAIRRQVGAYGISDVYNLLDLQDKIIPLYRFHIPYTFTDRSKEKKYLCYILAGYEPKIWDSTLARIEAFQSEDIDYCLVSSGIYSPVLEELAGKNGWSYLYTEQNQVCHIQNLAIELHPKADYIFKIDEDIFIGKDFFRYMIQEFHKIEKTGAYRIGFAVPVIPINCCGHVFYLDAIGKRAEFEEQFGRTYICHFSNVYAEEVAEYLWDTIDDFDIMAGRFLENSKNDILNAYFNIGCIMFTRERWYMMGKWPEQPGTDGMGADERFIYKDNWEKEMAIYEIRSVLAGHLAFKPQKERMLKYYAEHFEKFAVK